MNEQNENYETSNEIYFEEVEDETGLAMEMEEDVRSRFVGLIEERFADAEMAREADEERWLKAYHNFRGIYGKGVKFRES
jgi:hypothetical protein